MNSDTLKLYITTTAAAGAIYGAYAGARDAYGRTNLANSASGVIAGIILGPFTPVALPFYLWQCYRDSRRPVCDDWELGANRFIQPTVCLSSRRESPFTICLRQQMTGLRCNTCTACRTSLACTCVNSDSNPKCDACREAFESTLKLNNYVIHEGRLFYQHPNLPAHHMFAQDGTTVIHFTADASGELPPRHVKNADGSIGYI